MYLLVIAIELTGAGCCLCKAGLPSVWILWNYEHLGSEKNLLRSIALHGAKKTRDLLVNLSAWSNSHVTSCCILLWLWLIHFVEGRIPPGAPPWMVAAGAWDLSCRKSRAIGGQGLSKYPKSFQQISSYGLTCVHACAKLLLHVLYHIYVQKGR